MRLALPPLCLLALACQPYDFSRVQPIALASSTEEHLVAVRGLKPNVMFVIDNSGSMSLPVAPGAPECPPGCGSAAQPCPASCATRRSELQRVLADFLATSGGVARFGSTSYPANELCGPPSALDVALPAPTPDDVGTEGALAEQAQRIAARVATLTPRGGTPTAAALAFVGAQASLRLDDGRDDYVVLLTDGLPNCNEQNPAQACSCDAATCGDCGAGVCAAQRQACRCTTSRCDGALCGLGCLDDTGSLAAVQALRAAGLRTAVIGFGAEVAGGDAAAVLSQLALAGGFVRTCASDDECGGSRCVAGACERALFLASDGAELGEALARVSSALPPSPCEFRLVSPPTDPSLLAVRVGGEHLAAGDDAWRYDAARGAVLFLGAACARITASTPSAPLAVEFRVVERL